MTGLAMTRERERGTFENLLATPALPIEVMTGKIVPYILIGLVQVTLLLAAALLLLDVPIAGSVALLYLAVLVFIAANLAWPQPSCWASGLPQDAGLRWRSSAFSGR